jgi:N-acetyl-D-muramate 6-phosphate phosphatase
MKQDNKIKSGWTLGAHAIEAILFDLDGTLMDTDDQAVARISRWFERLRLPHSQRLARSLVMAGETPVNALITFIDRLGIDQPLMDLWQRVSRKKGANKHDFQIIPGVKEMLNALSGRYRLAVVTTRSRIEAEAFIEEHHLQGIFELLVTRTSTRRLKPHPQPILFAADRLHVPVSRCLMVGDTTLDILSAKAAGAWSVGVLCGYGTREELEQKGATAVVEHIAEVATFVNNSQFDQF